MSRMTGRRARLGAGMLLAVMLLSAAGAGALGVYYAERADAERRAADRQIGQLFAVWFGAAHRASMETDYRTRLGGGGFLLTNADLRAAGVVPPGLPDSVVGSVSFSFGIVDDGAGVPMAFGVLEPSAWSNTASLREGALDGGLAQIEDITPLSANTRSEMHAHVPAIEAALGRAPAAGAMFATADRSVRYRDGVVYRRAQPGQSRLNRMETPLDAGGCGALNDEACDVLGIEELDAKEVIVTPDPLAPVASTVAGDGSGFKEAEVGGNLSSGTFLADLVTGSAMTVANALGMDSAEVAQGVTTATMTVSADVQSGAVSAGTATAQDATVRGGATATGASTIRTVASSTLGVSGNVGTGTVILAYLYGPSMTVSGALTVGSCAGCFPEASP